MIPAGASVPVSRTRAGTGRGERPKPHRTTWPGLPAVAGALSLLCHEIFLYPVYKVVFVKNKRLFLQTSEIINRNVSLIHTTLAGWQKRILDADVKILRSSRN